MSKMFGRLRRAKLAFFPALRIIQQITNSIKVANDLEVTASSRIEPKPKSSRMPVTARDDMIQSPLASPTGVVASISICTRLGNPIICRNYIELPFSRVEALLAAFPRLIEPGQQHSFVENDSARFLFQSLDQYFLVIITSKASNLLQDLETLRLVSRILNNQCPQYEEASFIRNFSSIIFAFDEIISIGGDRESITVPQVLSNLLMESAEEALQELIEKNKIQEAKEITKMKMKQLEMERKDNTNGSVLQKGLALMRGGMGSVTTPASPNSYGASNDGFKIQTEHIDVNTPKPRSLRAGKGMSLKGSSK